MWLSPLIVEQNRNDAEQRDSFHIIQLKVRERISETVPVMDIYVHVYKGAVLIPASFIGDA
jgi:hypothetical protein